MVKATLGDFYYMQANTVPNWYASRSSSSVLEGGVVELFSVLFSVCCHCPNICIYFFQSLPFWFSRDCLSFNQTQFLLCSLWLLKILILMWVSKVYFRVKDWASIDFSSCCCIPVTTILTLLKEMWKSLITEEMIIHWELWTRKYKFV